MKMKKIILTLVAIAFTATSSFAQKSNDGWFVNAGAGVFASAEGQITSEGSFGITPAVTANIGKWINGSLAIGVGYDGLKIKNDNFFPEGVKFNYAHADILWNTFNTFGGYKDRVFSLVPYIHCGAAINNATALCGGLGIQAPLHFGLISIVPDIKGNVIQDKVYSTVNKGYMGIITASVKLQINL